MSGSPVPNQAKEIVDETATTATITTTETTSPVIAPAPGAYEILSQDGSIRIPFDIFREDIRMQAMLNGVEVDLR